jgi:hypothetical protein
MMTIIIKRMMAMMIMMVMIMPIMMIMMIAVMTQCMNYPTIFVGRGLGVVTAPSRVGRYRKRRISWPPLPCALPLLPLWVIIM